MSLVGSYLNANTGETLTITAANDANGQLSGTLTSGGRLLQVQGLYHFANSVGPATSISLHAYQGDPNIFEGWALSGSRPDFTTLTAMGGRATITNGVMATVGVGGEFVRK